MVFGMQRLKHMQERQPVLHRLPPIFVFAKRLRLELTGLPNYGIKGSNSLRLSMTKSGSYDSSCCRVYAPVVTLTTKPHPLFRPSCTSTCVSPTLATDFTSLICKLFISDRIINGWGLPSSTSSLEITPSSVWPICQFKRFRMVWVMAFVNPVLRATFIPRFLSSTKTSSAYGWG